MNKQEAIDTIARYLPPDLRKQVLDAFSNPEWTNVLRKHLDEIGVQVRVAHFTGDSSYPTEYTLSHGDVQTGGEPTLDLAMVAFIEKLLQEHTS
jgi:hypothetical protein